MVGVRDQRRFVAGLQGGLHVGVEPHVPVEAARPARRRCGPGCAPGCRCRDEHPVVAQRRQASPDLEWNGRRLGGVDGQLHDGHVGGRIDVRAAPTRCRGRGPRPSSGLRAAARAAPDAAGELGVAGRRVLHAVERLREAAEVVDGAGPGHGGDRGPRPVPVGRHAEHGPGRARPVQTARRSCATPGSTRCGQGCSSGCRGRRRPRGGDRGMRPSVPPCGA